MTASATSSPLARVQLARDARRTLAIPALLVLLGAVAVAVAFVLFTGAPMFALAGAGLVLALVGVALAVRTRSLGLAVETDYLHLTGIGVDRRYHLVRGDLSRVASSGIGRVAVRPGTAALGFAAGRATLGGGEQVEIIRLGATPSVILVPTELGRVAIASAAEGELVDALMAAARTRASRPSAPTVAGLSTRAVVTAPAAPTPAAVAATVAIAPAPAPALVAMPLPRPVEPAPPPRPLTGIERMELEERLAVERRAAMSGARSEQAAASLTASAAAMTLPGRAAATFPPVAPTVAPAAPMAAATMQPAVSTIPAVMAPTLAPAPIPATAPASERAIRRALPRRRPQRPMARRIGPASLGPDIALLGGPLAAAAVVWALAVFVGSRPSAAGLDPIGAALLLSGPIAVLAAWLARSRWPRLAGLTSIAAVISLALVARALIS